jgi:hypothetical protein
MVDKVTLNIAVSLAKFNSSRSIFNHPITDATVSVLTASLNKQLKSSLSRKLVGYRHLLTTEIGTRILLANASVVFRRLLLD